MRWASQQAREISTVCLSLSRMQYRPASRTDDKAPHSNIREKHLSSELLVEYKYKMTGPSVESFCRRERGCD